MAENLTTRVKIFFAQVNISKTRRILGWAPQMGIEIGATEPFNWFKQVLKWGKDVTNP
jgi:nucleoside-diphosphate-sugar epimerase